MNQLNAITRKDLLSALKMKGLPVILTVILLTVSWSTFSQKEYTNEVFGFTVEAPENWSYYGSTEFLERENEGILAFYLPSDSAEYRSDWHNSISFVARANGYLHSIEDIVEYERLRLQEKLNEMKVLEESENRLLTQMIIHNILYNTLTLVERKNGISYIGSYTFQPNDPDIDSTAFIDVFNAISYSKSSISYDDINEQIEESPEDGTLFFKRAERAFNFHELETSLEDVNMAIELFPFYGEAFYLKGYIYLALGDTVEACRNFHFSISEDYAGETELGDYCNTLEITEALENGEEEYNPFEGFDQNANHLEYIDSIRTHEYIILSVRGEPSDQAMSYMNHINHLFALDYAQLDSIFQTETGIVRFYSFGILCRKFPDQVNKTHKKILKDKGEQMVLTSEQDEPYPKAIGELASIMYQSLSVIEEEKKMQAKTEKAVNKFIRKYAKNPKSYEPGEFVGYHEMHIADGPTLKKEKGSETYIIGHNYRIKDTSGRLVDCFNTFKFDPEFHINIIEKEESTTITSYPPRVDEWLEQYGRELSNRDKKKLGILN